MMDGKVCTQCKEFKSYEEYYKKKANKDGVESRCKVCRSQSDKNHHQKNKERRIDQMKQYYQENKEQFLKSAKFYREENKERIAEFKKRWAEKNKEHKAEQERNWRENNKERNIEMKKIWYKKNRDRVYGNLLKRRSLKYFVRFEGVRRKELLDRDNWTCRNCGVQVHDRNVGGNRSRHLWDDERKAHIDHIVPISKGGDSSPDNLQVLCRTCNLSKKDKISF
jgi:5-methylcytosine-specific restriction endonuclease McrA